MKRARDLNVDDEWCNIGSKRIRDNNDDASICNNQNCDGNQTTAMLDAVKNGDIVLVRTLLVQDGGSLSVNVKDKYERRTPLIVACLHGHLEIVKLLLEHGADVQVKNCKGSDKFVTHDRATIRCWGRHSLIKIWMDLGH